LEQINKKISKIIPKYSKDSSTEGFGARESDSTACRHQFRQAAQSATSAGESFGQAGWGHWHDF
jgi:hypothetical protein